MNWSWMSLKFIHWCSYWHIGGWKYRSPIVEAWWTASFRWKQTTMSFLWDIVIICNTRSPRGAMIFTQNLRWNFISTASIGSFSWCKFAISPVPNQGIFWNKKQIVLAQIILIRLFPYNISKNYQGYIEFNVYYLEQYSHHLLHQRQLEREEIVLLHPSPSKTTRL